MIRLRSLSFLLVGSLVALAACQTQTADEDTAQDEGAATEGESLPTLGARVDRIGRPEITNFVVRDRALKELYNAEDSFAMPAEAAQKYSAAMRASIVHYDAFDGAKDFDDRSAEALARILVEDQLRIDVSKPCGASGASYFDGERAEMLGRPATTCGGRAPNEDVFDTLMTFYTNGPARLTPRVGDGVDFASSTGPSAAAFPYLAKPHLLRQPGQ